ncbi:hypothetical protein [Siccirubricoccus phaeus]|uniref:hypothetical protein n=1 Tax=Siccirubricoccus phaeus TaxID=2595053 RepID=UPI0011F2A765|nr:hypothetical protein [Siccirubricoccus phaeus]
MKGALALPAGAALLLWPAALNGYPLLFSDTGAFLAQTVQGWAVWDKPFIYGPALHLFHGRVTLWGPVAAQALALSWLLRLTARVLGRPGWHLPLCALLALGSAAPWFTATLMPDWLAPALVLAMFLLGFGGAALRRAEHWGVAALAVLAVAAHLSHLPLAVALLVAVLGLRGWRAAGRCALPVALAVGLLLGSNLWAQGRLALSPYGTVFALARLVADGPAARTIMARCPGAGWHLCAWAGRLPADADDFLWSGDGPVWGKRTDGARPGGPISLAPEATAILRETLLREPGAVLLAALRNAARQLVLLRVGDTLGPENLALFVGRQLALGFPPAEQARFAAGRQARGELPAAAAPFLWPHLPLLGVGLGLTLWVAWRGAGVGRGLAVLVLLGLLANAAATGALSGPHDRYQARMAWLLLVAAPSLPRGAGEGRGGGAGGSGAAAVPTPRPSPQP